MVSDPTLTLQKLHGVARSPRAPGGHDACDTTQPAESVLLPGHSSQPLHSQCQGRWPALLPHRRSLLLCTFAVSLLMEVYTMHHIWLMHRRAYFASQRTSIPSCCTRSMLAHQCRPTRPFLNLNTHSTAASPRCLRQI